MLKIILGIVLGYIATVLIIVVTFNLAFMAMGADNAFQPGTFHASTKWLVMAVTVSLIAAVVGGAICALVSRRGLAVFLLADLILLGGAIMAVVQMSKPQSTEPRIGQVSNHDARTKAISPTWFVIAIPVIGFVGVWVGGAMFLRGERIHESTRIAAPVNRVFALASDIPNCTRWSKAITNVEMLTDGPTKVGTRWRETRLMMGKPHTETLEMTSIKPNQQYTVGCDSMGAKFTTELTFTPAGATATEVAMEMRTEPYTIGARLMSPLSGLFVGMIRKCLREDLTDLKQAAESGSPSTATT